MQRFFSFFSRRWFLVAFSAFILTILCGAYHSYCVLPNVYIARAEIEVDLTGATDPAQTLKSEIKLINSEDILMEVIFDRGWGKTWAKRVYKSPLPELPIQTALGYLKRLVRIYSKPDTNIIVVEAASEVPEETADMANSIADRYVMWRNKDGELTTKSFNEPKKPVEIISRAETPKSPSFPDHISDIFASVLEGIVLGALIGSLVEAMIWWALKTTVPPEIVHERAKISEGY